ncbi:torsin-1A-like [Erpetoichthys calabaricus]|uniref:torsin-1A-like n=1 Tax=Erpetoichthys calabaricus TaxID=27687 RepID=UPI0022343176|nr:torsin-1A-like [Erpetoichthys calabaricus]
MRLDGGLAAALLVFCWLQAAGRSGAWMFEGLRSYLGMESCDNQWISFNSTGLEVELKEKLFGQHLASHAILKAVTGFLNRENSKKPLVLSFHGWSGTGKNYVTKMIANHLYREGMRSSFVHHLIATIHFLHVDRTDLYKEQLQQWIKGNVSSCARSLFIFDEMDKLHPGLIDGIKPYLDSHDHVDGVSYRQAIFIFHSNAGGEKINKVALDFWKDGRQREEIQLSDLEAAVSLDVFNSNQSGLFHSDIIQHSLVSVFVPFLPLEIKHVCQCVRAELGSRGRKVNEKIVSQVARSMSYTPKDVRVFSVDGCKIVETKVDLNTDETELRDEL